MRAIRDRLREIYGIPLAKPHGHPIAELILTVLSQSTNDRNRDVAYLALRERFPTWEDMRDAPVDEIELAIRPGGISKVKSARIKSILRAIGELPRPEGAPEPGRPGGDDHLSLDWLPSLSVPEAQRYLTSLPGVGRKTAACVMIFALDRPEIPVDTHVHRVGGRVGLFPPAISLEGAHDEMLAVTDPEDAYELHLNLIEHGRKICRPRPRCGECGLARMCVARRAGLVEPVI